MKDEFGDIPNDYIEERIKSLETKVKMLSIAILILSVGVILNAIIS